MRTRAVLQGLTFAASLCLALPALALDGTLKKIKDSGAPPMVVRESSSGLPLTPVDRKFSPFHAPTHPPAAGHRSRCRHRRPSASPRPARG